MAETIHAGGGEAFPVVINMRDPESIKSAVQEVVDTAGRLDILVNNAAGNFVRPAESLPEKAFANVEYGMAQWMDYFQTVAALSFTPTTGA